MYTVVSTKKLSKSQRDYLSKNNILLIQKAFINISILDINVEYLQNKHIIFTSQNAIKSILPQKQKWKNNDIYCVGKQSYYLLKTIGIQVVHYENNGENLARYIINNHSCKEVYFFCGNQSRDELPNILSQHHITVHFIKVYHTTATPIKLNYKEVKQVLFFSPSAVDSFFVYNHLDNDTKCICIGTTTQNTLKKYTCNPIITSKTPSIDNVLKLSVEHKIII